MHNFIIYNIVINSIFCITLELRRSFIYETILIWINMAKLKISMTIDEEVFQAFKVYCQANGMKISTKVEQLMRDNIKDVPLQAFMK